MLYFRLVLKLEKIDTVLAGEYNSGTGNEAKISSSQHARYLKTFKKVLTLWSNVLARVIHERQ